MSDRLLIVARGDRADSLLIRLLAVVGTDTMMLDAWYSDYNLVDPPFPRDTAPEVVARYLKTALRETLDGLNVELSQLEASAFDQYEGDCTTDPRPCVQRDLESDSVTAARVTADILGSPRPVLRYRYGYESGVTKVWSPIVRKFIFVWGCC